MLVLCAVSVMGVASCMSWFCSLVGMCEPMMWLLSCVNSCIGLCERFSGNCRFLFVKIHVGEIELHK